ncbi:hypothetical protein OGZ01_06100 [Vibrio harveyi]|nr:hypothetical protein [Vibrio harveyi]
MSNATELAPIYTPVRNQFRQFSESLPLEATQDFYQAELVWGIVEGNQTPKILLLVLGDGNWHYSEPESLDALVFELLGENDMLGDESQYYAFICLADANNQRSYEF